MFGIRAAAWVLKGSLGCAAKVLPAQVKGRVLGLLGKRAVKISVAAGAHAFFPQAKCAQLVFKTLSLVLPPLVAHVLPGPKAEKVKVRRTPPCGCQHAAGVGGDGGVSC